MIHRAPLSDNAWHQRLEKMLNALIRARERAKEIARQTGTPLVYQRDGKIVREFVGSREAE